MVNLLVQVLAAQAILDKHHAKRVGLLAYRAAAALILAPPQHQGHILHAGE